VAANAGKYQVGAFRAPAGPVVISMTVLSSPLPVFTPLWGSGDARPDR